MSREDIACAKKARYVTRKEAKRAAKVVAELHGIRGLKPYVCEFCTCIHLGHRAGEATYRRYDFVNDPNRRV